jgi:hypothetical protein
VQLSPPPSRVEIKDFLVVEMTPDKDLFSVFLTPGAQIGGRTGSLYFQTGKIPIEF